MIKLILYIIIPVVYAQLSVDNGVPVISNNTYRYKREDGGEADETIVQTEYGPVRGYIKYGTNILQFFDIPYGEFNIDYPFQDPTPPQPWENKIDNPEHTSLCPQINEEATYIGRPDCLTLSIFSQNQLVQADVMFHIHDGVFKHGSGDPDVYRPDNLVSHGILLVLPNYRLGPLGYLCLQNETVPGNAALKDLALALNWTKHNIEAFGGNASNIVVSGAGSAGALVDYLVVTDKSNNYISKAITESGFAVSHWAIDREPLRTVENFPSFTINGDLESIFKNLKEFDSKPCVETSDGFINESYWNILNKDVNNIPYMIGLANQAGMHLVLQHNEESILNINSNFSTMLPNDLLFEGSEITSAANRFKTQYFGENNVTTLELEKLSLYLTDSAYLSPGIRQARLMAKAGFSLYFYEFSFSKDKDFLVPGSDRGSTLKYIFNNDSTLEIAQKTDEEQKIGKLMTSLWVSFIKSGVPTAENVEWNKWETNKEECLMIGTEVKLVERLHRDRLKLWDEIYQRHFIDNPSSACPIKPPLFIALVNILIGYLFTK